MICSGRWLCAIAAGGYLVFALAFSLNWRAPESWDRINLDAIAGKAAQVAREISGVEVSGWSRSTAPRVDHALEQWQRRHAKQALDRLVSPFHIRVTFHDPASIKAVEVLISPSGSPLAVRVLGPPRTRPPVAGLDQTASQALRVLAGDFAQSFQRDFSHAGDSAERFHWKAAAPSNPSLTWRLNVNLEQNRFRSASIEPVFSGPAGEAHARQARFFDGEAYQGVRGLVLFAGVVWAAFAYFSGWVRKLVDHHLAWKAAAAFVVFELASRFASGEGFTPIMLVGLAGIAVPLALVTGAGRIAASAREWPRWQAFVLFAEFRWHARPVGRSIVEGLSWAGAVAAIPFLVAGLFQDAALSVAIFGAPALSRIPVLAALTPLVERGTYGLLVFLAPIVFRRIASTAAALASFACLATAAIFLIANPFSAGIQAAAISACIAGALLTAIYWMHGLLATLTALKGAMILTVIAGFLRSGSLTAPAVLLAILAAAALASYRVSMSGREIEALDDRNISGAYLSAREKLKADFSLAQQAQQRMLPSQAPHLPGFSVAAACLPARDVGGDLYDYFEMPDGRFGVCVADVSGKGMPAALYMTLTKGVLTAAAPDCSGLAGLSSHLNRHIYAAGKRKVFVTAVLVAIDAATQEVEFVRAGHNPILLRSAGSGTARYLNSRGMGLGMTGGALFERATSLERLSLDPGDSLVLYSDGVTEAMNSCLEQYGEDRLKQVVERAASMDAAALLAEIRRDVAGFTGDEPAHDDITIVVLHVGSVSGRSVNISS